MRLAAVDWIISNGTASIWLDYFRDQAVAEKAQVVTVANAVRDRDYTVAAEDLQLANKIVEIDYKKKIADNRTQAEEAIDQAWEDFSGGIGISADLPSEFGTFNDRVLDLSKVDITLDEATTSWSVIETRWMRTRTFGATWYEGTENSAWRGGDPRTSSSDNLDHLGNRENWYGEIDGFDDNSYWNLMRSTIHQASEWLSDLNWEAFNEWITDANAAEQIHVQSAQDKVDDYEQMLDSAIQQLKENIEHFERERASWTDRQKAIIEEIESANLADPLLEIDSISQSELALLLQVYGDVAEEFSLGVAGLALDQLHTEGKIYVLPEEFSEAQRQSWWQEKLSDASDAIAAREAQKKVEQELVRFQTAEMARQLIRNAIEHSSAEIVQAVMEEYSESEPEVANAIILALQEFHVILADSWFTNHWVNLEHQWILISSKDDGEDRNATSIAFELRQVVSNHPAFYQMFGLPETEEGISWRYWYASLETGEGIGTIVGSFALFLAPEPTLLTKAGGGIAFGHGTNRLWAGVSSFFGRDTRVDHFAEWLEAYYNAMGVDEDLRWIGHAGLTTSEFAVDFASMAALFRVGKFRVFSGAEWTNFAKQLPTRSIEALKSSLEAGQSLFRIAKIKSFGRFANASRTGLGPLGRWMFSEADAIAKVSDESLAFATRLRKLGDPPSCSTAIFDARTGRMYHGVSGAVRPEKIHPFLQGKIDEIAKIARDRGLQKGHLERWKNVTNCAEFQALNRALLDEGNLDDLFIHTMRPGGKYGPFPFLRCQNCQIFTDWAKWITP